MNNWRNTCLLLFGIFVSHIINERNFAGTKNGMFILSSLTKNGLRHGKYQAIFGNISDYFYKQQASGHPCKIPSLVKGWTLHGLWPTGMKSYPSFCRDWKFDVTLIEDLEDDLLRVWPNLYAKESMDSLWKHEYEKHGTCAARIKGFQHEHDYFQRTLEMREKYSIERVLFNNDVFPRPEGYKASFIQEVIQSGYKYTVCPGCGYVKGVGQVLSQFYVCIDKHLKQTDCPVCEKPCRKNEEVLYQPLHFT